MTPTLDTQCLALHPDVVIIQTTTTKNYHCNRYSARATDASSRWASSPALARGFGGGPSRAHLEGSERSESS
eukprot:3787722-Heterocapsa_arctica.AAC.1